MCVQTANRNWERPAKANDITQLEKYFPEVNFKGMLKAMSVDGCIPLTTDLVLFAGILTVDMDDLGMRFVPFAGIDSSNPTTVVKHTIMDGIVDWMENTALGSYMWKLASEWAEKEYGCRIEFSMNCGCGSVALEAYENGNWPLWVQRL